MPPDVSHSHSILTCSDWCELVHCSCRVFMQEVFPKERERESWEKDLNNHSLDFMIRRKEKRAGLADLKNHIVNTYNTNQKIDSIFLNI